MKINLTHKALKSDRPLLQQEIDRIQIYQSHAKFERMVQMIRILCRIPEDGFNMDFPVAHYREELKEVDFKELAIQSMGLTRKYRLSPGWSATFHSIIFCNTAVPPLDTQPLTHRANKREIVIKITEEINLSDISAYIREHGKELKQQMQKLPRSNKKLAPIKYLGVYQEVAQIRAPKKSATKIIKELDRLKGPEWLLSSSSGADLHGDNTFSKYVNHIIPQKIARETNTEAWGDVGKSFTERFEAFMNELKEEES